MNPNLVRLLCILSAGTALVTAPDLRAQGAPTPPAERVSPASSWIGKYSCSALEFELKPGLFGGLAAVLRFPNEIYFGTARAEGDKVSGNLQIGAESVPYQLVRNGPEFRFLAVSREYKVQREGAAVAAPATPSPDIGSPAAPTPPPPATGKLVQISVGYSFRLPAGWTSKETPENVILLPPGVSFDPSRNDNPEVYLAASRNDYDSRTESELAQQLGASVAQQGGTGGQRQAMTFGQRKGAVYRWDLRDATSGRPAAFDIYLVTEGQRAFVLVAAGEKTRIRSNDASVRQLLSSVAFAAPAAEASDSLADSTPLAQRWLNKLRGKHVRQFWASAGMSSDKTHSLGADGSYSFKSSSMVSVDVSGASALSTGRDASTGRWRIRDISGKVFLEVSYRNGNVRRMPITEDNRNWYLNGEKAFAVNPE